MLPLSHMGITFALARLFNRRFKVLRFDYRLLLIGALLPDLIDKPLGYLISEGHVLGKKAFGHSLLFLLLLFIFALGQRRRNRNHTLGVMLFIGSFAHDVLDMIWLHPESLFWPGYGWYEAISKAIVLDFRQLISIEIVMGVVLLYFCIKIVANNQVTHFIKTGRLADSNSEFRKNSSVGNLNDN